MAEISIINTINAPTPKGAYSQGTVYKGMVYVAGQLPIDPKTDKVVEGGFKEQVKQAILNVKAVLEAGNSNLDSIVKLNAYLTDDSQFPLFNEVYSNMFDVKLPPRTTCVVSLGGYDIEIDAIGVVCK